MPGGARLAEEPCLKFDHGRHGPPPLAGMENRAIAKAGSLPEADVVRRDGAHLPVEVDFPPQDSAFRKRNIIEG